MLKVESFKISLDKVGIMKRTTLPPSLARGIKGPVNFFPFFFFHEELDQNWVKDLIDLPRLQHMNFPSYMKNIEKAPLIYLSEEDLKVLYFLEAGRTFDNILFAIRMNCEMPFDQIKRLEAILKTYREQINLSKPSFLPMSEAFLTFFYGLSSQKEKSRKFMSLAEHHMAEALERVEDENHHPYGLLFVALTQVGRGLWDEATKTIKNYSLLKPGPQVFRILIKLYLHMGMREEAKAIERQAVQHRQKIKETPIGATSWPLAS